MEPVEALAWALLKLRDPDSPQPSQGLLGEAQALLDEVGRYGWQLVRVNA